MSAQNYKRWFDTSAAMRSPTDGNLVNFFVTGEEAFADIADVLEYTAADGASAYLSGWSFDIHTQMRTVSSSPAGDRIGQLLDYFTKHGGEVRAMLWDNNVTGPARGGCPEGVEFINALPAGPKSRSSAILDSRTPLSGAHHQKLQIVIGPGPEPTVPVAVGYCGGMDLVADRVGPDALHDVHCKVRGPAADDLVQVFQDRWNDHPHPDTGPALSIQTARTPFASASSIVQVCCTYPAFQDPLTDGIIESSYRTAVNNNALKVRPPSAGDMRDGGSVRYYDFYPAAAGVQQIWRAVKKAIGEATRYIYLEDQYLTSKWVGDALADKLTYSGDDFRIVIVLLHPDLADIEQIWPRRREALLGLMAADPRRERWTVVCRAPDKPHPYVHSKTWIFDDELVITGSANADRRGYTYNSETNLVIAGDVDNGGDIASRAATVAQDLRARLFAKHLGGKPAQYLDPANAMQRWFGNLHSTNVAVFNPAAEPGRPDQYVADLIAAASTSPLLTSILNSLPNGPEEFVWNYLEDPDHRVPLP